MLKQLDLQRYSPLVIFDEHKFLSAADKTACREMLRGEYEIEDLGHDDFCWRKARRN